MKYSKDKKKKLQKEGKTPQQIMEEARRNQAIDQAIEQGIQAENNTFRAMNIRPVSTLATTVAPIMGQVNPNVATTPERQLTFGEAFAQARKAGLKEFTWNNKSFTTDLAGKPTAKTPINTNTNVKTVTRTPTSTAPINDITYEGDILPEVVAIGKAPSSIAPKNRTSSFWHRLKNLPGYYTGAVTPQEMYGYKQGGQLPLYQQGGILNHFKGWLSNFLADPNLNKVAPNIYTTYKERTPFIGLPKETRSIFGPNGQVSNMIITRPNTSRADTTFVAPGYAKDPDLYPKFTPQDIREGNIKGKGKESYLQKFTNPEYFPHTKRYQQGGSVNGQDNAQKYVELGIRFLSAKGISEEEMVDETGGIREEYANEIAEMINEVNTPEFWEAYTEDPDRTIAAYIESKQTPEEIEMAKKGMKLKSLKDKKARKCKCGCNLTLKKGEGGTIVEVCACGCKNK